MSKFLYLCLILGLVSCNSSSSMDSTGSSSADAEMYSNAQDKNLRILLTDAPLDAKSVVVNVDHIELWLRGLNGNQGKINFAQDIGAINLLDLKDGKVLPLHDVQIPSGIILDKIRVILKPEGHYVEKNDGSLCELKTPSAQKTGIKININNDITIEENSDYSLVVDFDAEKSVVQKGNGGCNLKPVLKIKSLTRISSQESETNNSEDPVEDLNSEENSNENSSSDGYDDTADNDVPSDIVDGDFSNMR